MKVQGQERILTKHLNRLERSDFFYFDKPRKHACQKEKSDSNKQKKQERRSAEISFVEKGGVPERVLSF